jgi:hypothetical protein
MRQLGFLGNTRLREAQSLLQPIIEGWRSQWCFADGKQLLTVVIEPVTAVDTLAEQVTWQRAEIGSSVVRCAGAWTELIYGPHAHDVPTDATAKHLLANAQLALINALLGGLGHKPVALLLNESALSKVSPLSSELLIRLFTPKATLYVLIDAELLNSFLPVRSNGKALVERKAAIGGAKLKLHVQLHLHSLPIDEVQDIKVGDILRGEDSLGHPLHLTTDSTHIVANGYLARQQDHLAVQLVSRNKPEV